jgi:hypothetical protein
MTIQFDGTTNQATVGDLVANSVQVGGVSVNLYPLVSGNTLTYNWNGLTTNTVLDFTGIPSTAKRVTVMFSGVSTSGTSGILVQIGISTGIDALTYASGSLRSANGSTTGATYTTGFGISSISAAYLLSGNTAITNISGNIWVAAHTLADSVSGNIVCGGGTKTLSGVLDRVRITTVNGTDTIDAGSINIMWE